MKKGRILRIIIFILSAACSGFIYYCERLQLAPFTARGRIGRIAAAAFAGGVFFWLLFFLLRHVLAELSKKEWIPILLIALIASVCVTVWFPIPDTGLYTTHDLSVRALPDENGEVRPLTFTWLHRADRDIPLDTVVCSGNCSADQTGITLHDGSAGLQWHGITGNTITVEFVSGEDRGSAEFSWDGMPHSVSLNNAEMERLSFDTVFPPADRLAEFTAFWFLTFMLCLAAVIAEVRLLPKWDVRLFGIGAFLCFAAFRLVQFLLVSEPLLFVDSESYLGMSEMPVMDILRGVPYCHEQFWYCIARPAFIPLVYKICRQDPAVITCVQLAVSLLSWGFFVWQSAALCRQDSRKKALIILILGLGCIPNVTRWDSMIMSESLSISASLLLMGSCFWLLRPNDENRWKVTPALCTAFGALLYAHSRDTAVWSVILVIILLLCLNRLRQGRKVIFLLSAGLILVCWSVMGNTGGRWQYPFENVLFNRIVRDPQAEQFFIQAGMPRPPRIEELYGVEHMMGSELFNSEEMAPLRDWILTNGLKTYISYMLLVPGRTLRMAWNAGFEREAFEQIGYIFTPEGFRNLLPDPLLKFFSCNLPGVLIIGLGLAGIWRAFRSSGGERLAFPLLFVLSAYILCSGVLIADEYEFARHSMVIIIMMKASAWPLICLLTEISS